MQIAAGQSIGYVLGSNPCSNGHIHFAMRYVRTKQYIDPSKYLEGRGILWPKWDQQCDHYLLRYKVLDLLLLYYHGHNLKNNVGIHVHII